MVFPALSKPTMITLCSATQTQQVHQQCEFYMKHLIWREHCSHQSVNKYCTPLPVIVKGGVSVFSLYNTVTHTPLYMLNFLLQIFLTTIVQALLKMQWHVLSLYAELKIMWDIQYDPTLAVWLICMSEREEVWAEGSQYDSKHAPCCNYSVTIKLSWLGLLDY